MDVGSYGVYERGSRGERRHGASQILMKQASPYSDLPRSAFWRSGVAQPLPYAVTDVYAPKWAIDRTTCIATAGSCFAQHIGQHITRRGYRLLDLEPPPTGLPRHLHTKFGYSIYSARYGNIYNPRQFLQLTKEAFGQVTPATPVWERAGRYYDAQRPTIEPGGFASREELLFHREHHLACVRELVLSADVFVFTLGLTEVWTHAESGTVYPTAPGTVAGEFDASRFRLHTLTVGEVDAAIREFLALAGDVRPATPPLRLLLTVSPVPLTATASKTHVLVANSHSKAVLRAAAGQLESELEEVDYFPSYELITNPAARTIFYEENLRTVRPGAVQMVMSTFFRAHEAAAEPSADVRDDAASEAGEARARGDAEDVICEDALLDAFADGAGGGA